MRPETVDPMLEKMVNDQMISRGITAKSVIDAFLNVPRPLFVDPQYRSEAYEDYPLPIGYGQTVSQPFIVALMTDSVHLTKQDKVLEIGTGSGYQTAILAMLAQAVFTVERIRPLQEGAKLLLNRLNYDNVHYRIGNGYRGWEEHAPYDAIVVTASAPYIPPALWSQLKLDGRMVIPAGIPGMQTLWLITKENGLMQKRPLCSCRFVPMIDHN